MSGKKKKWDDAYLDANFSLASPVKVLVDNDYLLPDSGVALDLACGRAGNAQFLAKKGFSVDAMDFSSVVLKGLSEYATEEDLDIHCVLRDIEDTGLGTKQYDVIVVSYFLNREIFSQIIDILKFGGLLFYQTFVREKAVADSGPSNPQFLLKANELLELATALQVRVYFDLGCVGDCSKGLRNESCLIAQKSGKKRGQASD